MKNKNKEGVEKRSVSGPSALFEEADDVAKERRMTFSEYIRDLIRRDAAGELPVKEKAA